MKRGKKLTKDDDGDVDGAEDPELVGLLEEPVLALDDVEDMVCGEGGPKISDI